jgi:hypothetical protein
LVRFFSCAATPIDEKKKGSISLPSKTPNAVVEPRRFQLAKHMNLTFLASQRGVLHIPHFIGQDWIGRSVIWVPSVRVCLGSGRESLKFVFDLDFQKWHAYGYGNANI